MFVIHVLQVSEAVLFVVLRFDPWIKTGNGHPNGVIVECFSTVLSVYSISFFSYKNVGAKIGQNSKKIPSTKFRYTFSPIFATTTLYRTQIVN